LFRTAFIKGVRFIPYYVSVVAFALPYCFISGCRLIAPSSTGTAAERELPAVKTELPAVKTELPADERELPADESKLPADESKLPAVKRELPTADESKLPAVKMELPTADQVLRSMGPANRDVSYRSVGI